MAAFRRRLPPVLGILILVVGTVFGVTALFQTNSLGRLFAIGLLLTVVAAGPLTYVLLVRLAAQPLPYQCVLSDWGVEYDAPPSFPGRGVTESGGRLAWEQVAAVLTTDQGGSSTLRATSIYFHAEWYDPSPAAAPLPPGRIWGLRVNWVPSADAAQLVAVAEQLKVRRKGEQLAAAGPVPLPGVGVSPPTGTSGSS